MKLVRDNIPRKFPQHSYRMATPSEWPILLRMKVAEEAGEVIGARNRDELVQELGDLQTAIWALARREGIDAVEIERALLGKKYALGGFTQGWVMTEYRES